MAITQTSLAGSSSTANATSYTTASQTPKPNKLQIAVISNSKSGGTATEPTLTGNSVTWVKIDTQLFGTSNAKRVTIFRGLVLAPTAGTVAIDFGATAQNNCAWSFFEFGGVDTSGTNGSGAIVQSAKNAVSTVTTITVNLAAFSSTNNGTVAGFCVDNNLAITPDTGWAEILEAQVSDGADSITGESQWRNDNDTTAVATWTGNQAAGGIAVEIKASDINFDAASGSGYQAAASTYNWSHTCTGSNLYLVVGVSMLSLAQTVSGITYNSVAMTFLGAQNSVTGAARVELWGLANPSTGANTIAVTLTGAIASGANASSYTGVHQTVSTEAFSSAQATNVGAADATVNITTVADLDYCVDAVATDDTAITVGTGQIQTGNITGAGGSAAMSYEGAETPAGTFTMSWTNVAALATWSIATIGLRPVSATGNATVKQLAALGVG